MAFIQSRSSLENHNPIPGQNGQSVHPFSDQNGAKTLPDGAAQYIVYIREFPPRSLGQSKLLAFITVITQWTKQSTIFVCFVPSTRIFLAKALWHGATIFLMLRSSYLSSARKILALRKSKR